MRNALQTTLCLLSYWILVTGCEDKPHAIDVSGIEADVRLVRLDRQWFDMSAVGFRKLHPEYLDTLPELYPVYIEDILQLGQVDDSDLFAHIHRFTIDSAIAEVRDSVARAFEETDWLINTLNDAWKHYIYYFPDKELPRHAAFIGGFSSAFVMTEHEIGIGLEMFLGKKCVFYEYLQLPRYMRARMTKKHLVPWLMKNWLETEFPLEGDAPTLFEHIIWQGKVLYALDAIFPETNDTLKIGYTQTQLQWAEDHEEFVWAHFVDNSLLFTREPAEIAKFTSDGPFTVDLVKESPPRMGHYIGWQLVRSYMEETAGSISSLFAEHDAGKILKLSKYKP